MALSRRTGARFQGSIWPGFVDAMTGLLLVLMFVLTIFMIVQFVLTERITGQETELDALSGEVAALAQALGLEERSNAQLEARLGALNASLRDAQGELTEQSALIAALTSERDQQAENLRAAQSQITGFEAQVAALLAERDGALTQIGALETRQSELLDRQQSLLDEQEALNLALAASRSEIDAQEEAARLAAARREALDALVADLQARNAEAQEQVTALQGQIAETTKALSEEEAAKLAEAAAAEALRAKLQDADAELTAMTLALEAKRKEAEETLTLLAAARASQSELDDQLIKALISLQAAETAAKVGEDAQAEVGRLQGELTVLRAELDRARAAGADTELTLTAQGDALRADLAAAQGQIAQLEQDLETSRARLSADRDALREELAQARVDIAVLEQALQDNQTVLETDRATLRAQLAEALAAKIAAQALAEDNSTDAQKQAALVSAAQAALAEEKQISSEAQRQTELLNQQVAALRTQLGDLRALLDDAELRDAAKTLQLESLGSDLNTALARVAAEESRRAALEAAERARLEAKAKDLEQYRSEFFGRLRDVLGNQDGVRIEGDRFVFSSEVLFPPGGAVLSDDGQAEIAKVARILQSVADDIPPEIDWVIRVDGHTDNVPLSGLGEFADNWELSQARALSVVKYMISALGIAPDRLAANGFGQYQPVAAGDSEEARAQNRRIELKFTEK
ncbi:peptidoglycan -binding protein [Sulfitobacter mediterraneus]|uniref:peptidoglycan -binding protein n=1 Tax=Sulfitobacter mediterraneus TaxID=83219 RepID=UPI001932D764|nr:peptidoglycan -binding protein [Sulfitobacter mediterraneus]MBM1633684.1 peptidoglycan -binding protein [Sulfitobacter mediterraneus]MBM1641801.1 peptidoglycan -binding protein [Sulfitobacter mediterraneus]MBM1645548.1 peptidoglycan -binding protein [Sulfitobacter mediterraneus]MBM1649920.1 peptidoglycan -binding protein [Sulfitobacter mediterraneus]MBM1653617.1 peptidoglycan -binding protein [Sulfitobacter mediterraneus]